MNIDNDIWDFLVDLFDGSSLMPKHEPHIVYMSKDYECEYKASEGHGVCAVLASLGMRNLQDNQVN